jgi:hypothetical protein
VISRPLSAFEGVQKYFGAVYALRDIDLFIGRNEIVRLSSSVTTGLANRTRIKVITGVLEPTSRRIFLREHEILPGEILGPHGARPADRDGLPGQVAGGEATAVAQFLCRQTDHQPLRLHRRQAPEGARAEDSPST